MTTDLQLHDPQTLYRHWEDERWSPFEIALEADAEQWRSMDADDRSLVFWALASLMVAEERITTKFSGLVGAYGTEEEASSKEIRELALSGLSRRLNIVGVQLDTL